MIRADKAESSDRRLLSVHEPRFTEGLELALSELPDVALLHRISRSAGRRDWYIVARPNQLEAILERARPRDAISIFLRPQFPLRGALSEDYVGRILELVYSVDSPRTEVLLAVKGSDPLLRDVEGLAREDAEVARTWCRNHWGHHAVAGIHPPLVAANPGEIITGYFPDSDGSLNQGVY
jgi:hypothetical protein